MRDYCRKSTDRTAQDLTSLNSQRVFAELMFSCYTDLLPLCYYIL